MSTEPTPAPFDHLLDPEMVPIARRMRERMASRVPMTSIAPSLMRERAAADFAAWNEDPPPMAEVRDLILDDVHGLPARLYVPKGASESGGLLVHFHGGGWVIGDIGFEDRACRSVALESGVRVLSFGYRLSPEVKFPVPIEDCVGAAIWAQEHAKTLRIDPKKIALGGASAGANLAMSATLMMRDRGLIPPKFLVLLYGVYAMRTDTESHRLFGDGNYGLGAAALDFFMSLYLREKADRANPLVSPVLADLSGFPPAFIAIAGIDPLRDDSRELADKLRVAGVVVEAREYAGVLHGFTQFARESAQGRRALSDAAAALRAGLA
jgi:acetyl esterase